MTASVEHVSDSPYTDAGHVVLVDLDSTLFDTRRFGADLWREIADHTTASAETVRRDADAFRQNSLLGGYDFEQHVASYGLNQALMWRRLQQLLATDSYLYDDAPEFIQGLRTDGFEPRILSFGERRIQTAKIVSCMAELVGPNAVDLAFDVTNLPKRVPISRHYPNRRGVLVDDVQGQQLPTGFIEINLDRSRNLQEPEAIVGGFVVSNLAQARSLIASLYDPSV